MTEGFKGVERLVWVDLETFGLDPERDPIIEAGFVITDLSLNMIAEMSVLIWESGIHDHCFKRLKQNADAGKQDAKYVLDMHDKSGLWFEARAKGKSSVEAEVTILEWMDEHEINGSDPLCGNSVGFDRGFLKMQMYRVEERFHYRNIDNSSIKELCRRYNPRVFSLLDEATQPKKLHRALPDLDDSVNEFKFYLDNFLFDSREEISA